MSSEDMFREDTEEILKDLGKQLLRQLQNKLLSIRKYLFCTSIIYFPKSALKKMLYSD
jgi:hypothetical protein